MAGAGVAGAGLAGGAGVLPAGVVIGAPVRFEMNMSISAIVGKATYGYTITP